jgi:hypothetical protein
MTSESLRHSTPSVMRLWSSTVKRRFASVRDIARPAHVGLHRHHAAANVHANGGGNDGAFGGNNAAHGCADTPVHIGHGRDPLKNEWKLGHVQKLRSRLVFERDTLAPRLYGHTLFSDNDVVAFFFRHGGLRGLSRHRTEKRVVTRGGHEEKHRE